jgi:hypothetical protein
VVVIKLIGEHSSPIFNGEHDLNCGKEVKIMEANKDNSLKFAIRELYIEDVLNSSDQEFENFKLITKDPLIRALKIMYNDDKEINCKQNKEYFSLLKALIWNIEADLIPKELYINLCFNPKETLENIEPYNYISISNTMELFK